MTNSKLHNIIMRDAIDINLDEIENKSILITGASGLIGIHILAALKKFRLKTNKNFTVFAVINSSPEDYFLELLNFDNVFYIQGDLTDYYFCNSLPKADIIIHSAGYAQPVKFMKDQSKTITLNTTVTMQLFKRLNDNGKFIFISTSEVYSGLTGNLEEYMIGNTTPSHPRACYIESKRCGEAICSSYKNQGYDVKIARLSLAYGTGVKLFDTRVLNTFIKKAFDSTIDLMDDGSAIRSYCYVSDAVEMILNILLFGKDFIYNVGGISKISIKDLAYLIGRKLNSAVELSNNKGLLGAPNEVILDLSKYKNEFQKDNFMDLNRGVDKVIEWYKELLK